MRVKKGEIYVSACGQGCGHLVLNVEKYKYCDDIITQPFTANGIYGEDFTNGIPDEIDRRLPNRIDKFKLTMVRYFRLDDIHDPKYDWIPKEVFEVKLNEK